MLIIHLDLSESFIDNSSTYYESRDTVLRSDRSTPLWRWTRSHQEAFSNSVGEPIEAEDTDGFRNSTNHYQDSWCPFAKCKNSPMCTPCKRRFLFIVTNGRSGSTTLLRMLNYLPNVRLSGENNGMLLKAYQLEKALRNGTRNLLAEHSNVNGAWTHGGIPPQSFACPIQHLVHAINPPPTEVMRHLQIGDFPSMGGYDESTILGLKTIRLANSKMWTPQGAAHFFKENFPCAKIIVNIRKDIKNQIKSSKRAGWDLSDREIERKLVMSNSFLANFAEKLGALDEENGKRSKLVFMEDWANDVGEVNKLVQWLGFDHCDVATVLHENRVLYSNDSRDDIGIDYTKCRYAGG